MLEEWRGFKETPGWLWWSKCGKQPSLVLPGWLGCQDLLSVQRCARSSSHGDAEGSTSARCGRRCVLRAIVSSALFVPLAVWTAEQRGLPWSPSCLV